MQRRSLPSVCITVRLSTFHEFVSKVSNNLLLSERNDLVLLLQENKFLTQFDCVDGEATFYENGPNCKDAIKGCVTRHTKLVRIECVIRIGGVNRQMPGS